MPTIIILKQLVQNNRRKRVKFTKHTYLTRIHMLNHRAFLFWLLSYDNRKFMDKQDRKTITIALRNVKT